MPPTLTTTTTSSRSSKSSPETEKRELDTRTENFENGTEDESVSDFLDSLSAIGEQDNQDDVDLRDDEPDRHSSMSLDMGMKRGAGRKQHWKSQSMGESLQQTQHLNSLQINSSCSQDDELQEQTTFSANRELWQRRATSQTQLTPPVPPTPKSIRSSQEFREMRQKHTPDLVMDLPLSAQDTNKKSASSNSLSSSDEEAPIQTSRALETAKSPSTVGPESPDMSTAAERFAKQNQCTLKKNTKSSNETGTTTKLKRLETDIEPDTDTEPEIVRSTSNTEISSSTENMPLRSPLPSRSTPKIAAKFADMRLTGGSQQQQQVSSFKPQVKIKPTILRKPVKPFPVGHMSPELARKIEKQQVQNNAEQAN